MENLDPVSIYSRVSKEASALSLEQIQGRIANHEVELMALRVKMKVLEVTIATLAEYLR